MVIGNYVVGFLGRGHWQSAVYDMWDSTHSVGLGASGSILCRRFCIRRSTKVRVLPRLEPGYVYPYIQNGRAAASAGWGPAWDINQGIDQEWTFSYDGTGYGFSATVEWGGDNFFGAGSSTNTGNGAYSWFDTYYNFGKFAQIMLGNPQVTQFSQASPIEGVAIYEWNYLIQSEFAAMLQLYPMSGAILAGGLYLPQNSNNPLVPGANLSAFGNAQAGTSPNFGNNWFIAAQYAVPNMATVNAFVNMTGNMGATTATNKDFNINANITAIPNLPIVFRYAAEFADSSNVVNHGMLGVTDAMGPLTVKLEGALAMDTKVSSFAAQGELQYALANPYGIGVQPGCDDGNGVNWFDWGSGDWAGLEIYPYVIANYDNGSDIRLGFLHATGATPGTAVSTASVPNAQEKNATTALVLDYI